MNKDFFDGNQPESSQDTDAAEQQDNQNIQQSSEVADSDEQKQASKCLTELAMWQDQCKRISAEFENFKRRTERDKVRWAEIANESLLLELLSFLDTFQAALKQKDGVDYKGIEMVHQALLKVLQKYDVSPMPATQEFNPEIHEAVLQLQSDQHKSGQIVEILSPGFMIKDRILRPAKVSVAT